MDSTSKFSSEFLYESPSPYTSPVLHHRSSISVAKADDASLYFAQNVYQQESYIVPPKELEGKYFGSSFALSLSQSFNA